MNNRDILEVLENAPLVSYKERLLIPPASGVYAAWLKHDPNCLYIGKSTNLNSRIRSHFSGQRGGDQFCLYVYDRYIHSIRPADLDTPGVNTYTANWIKDNVLFKFMELPESDISYSEDWLRKALKPLLNPLRE